MTQLARTIIIFFSLCSTFTNSEPLYPSNIIDSLKDSDHDGVIDARDVCENTKLGSNIDHYGCPATQLDFFTFNFDVQFDTGKHQLKAEFHEKLEDLALFLDKHSAAIILIEGHTDNQGTESYNQVLSKKRAESIANALTSEFNIKPNQIKTFGYGQERPVASNSNEAGRESNRRVSGEIITPIVYPISSDLKVLTIPFETIEKKALSVIDNLGLYLINNPESLVIIEGYTDNIGDKISNLALSEQQANKIAVKLSSQYSIPQERIKVLGYGQDFPIASNNTFEGREKNRRIEITVATRFKTHKEISLKKWTIWNIDNDS